MISITSIAIDVVVKVCINKIITEYDPSLNVNFDSIIVIDGILFPVFSFIQMF